MSKPVKTGGTVRTNLEIAAARGNKFAIKALISPSRPYALLYLWRWHVTLNQGLGDGPLDWSKFDAWARRMHADPYPHETTCLFLLDKIAREPKLLKEILT